MMTENATAARRLSPCEAQAWSFSGLTCDHDSSHPRCDHCKIADAFTALLDEHDRERPTLTAVAKVLQEAYADLVEARTLAWQEADHCNAYRTVSVELEALEDTLTADLARAQGTCETLRAERDGMLDAARRFQPTGSPPPGDGRALLVWVLADLHDAGFSVSADAERQRERAERAEAQLRDVEAERDRARGELDACRHEANAVLETENAALRTALEDKDPPPSEYRAVVGMAAKHLWPMLRVWGEECQRRKMALRACDAERDRLRARVEDLMQDQVAYLKQWEEAANAANGKEVQIQNQSLVAAVQTTHNGEYLDRAMRAEAALAAQTAEYARLRAALERFGHHSAGCAVHAAGTWMHADAPECGCGLSAHVRPPTADEADDKE